MPIVRLLYDNHGLDGLWDANSQVATLPACHLADASRQKVWRSTGAGTCDRVRVNTCSTSLSVDRIAFVTYNLTTCAFVGIEAHCTSCFEDGASPPGFTTCFAPWAAPRTKVCFHDLSARQTGRKWWRAVVCDTGNDDGYYEIGVLALGIATCLRVAPERMSYTVVDPSLVEYAPAGTPWTFPRDPYAIVELPHRFLAEALLFDGFQDVLRTGGRRQDMVLSLFTSEPACTCVALMTNLYGRFEELPRIEYVMPGLYDATLRFRESL